jgi:hypothetical protein
MGWLSEERKPSFCEQKEAKKLHPLASMFPWKARWCRRKIGKVFLLLFLQKKKSLAYPL